jgi:hypothetical protein
MAAGCVGGAQAERHRKDRRTLAQMRADDTLANAQAKVDAVEHRAVSLPLSRLHALHADAAVLGWSIGLRV